MTTFEHADSIIPAQTTRGSEGVGEDIESRPESPACVAITEKARVNTAPHADELQDYARKLRQPKGWDLAILSWQAIGVVYGDIGTSPLYVLNGIFPADGAQPSAEDVLGVISAIFWVWTLTVLVKYGLIVMQFGTGVGEGGPFAVYCSLFPKAVDEHDDPHGARDRALTTFWTKRSTRGGAGSEKEDRRATLLRHVWVKPLLCGVALVGSAMTLADGLLTPAISVLSAAEGIAVVKPSTASAVVPISIGILLALGIAQYFGLRRISHAFAPAVFLWLMALLLTGAANVHTHPGIFRALDPSRAVLYFVRTGNYDALAGIILAITGVEALFANLESLSREAVRIPLLLLVYPSLMLAYLGQGARLIEDPAVLENVFYRSIPGEAGGPIYWTMFALGLMATIVASQALLSASFAITRQLSHMGSLPPLAFTYPDADFGQPFSSVVNVALIAAIVAVIGVAQHSANLSNAYGFAVVTTMLITTLLVSVSIVFVKHRSWLLAALFLVAFGFLDGLLWGATLRKVPHGAWFSLAVGGGLAIFLWFWTWATGLISSYELRNSTVLSSLLRKGNDEDDNCDATTPPTMFLRLADGRTRRLTRAPALAVFWKPHGGAGVPASFAHFLGQLATLPTLTVFLSVRHLAVPSVPRSQRLVVSRARAWPGIYAATLRIGCADKATTSLAELNALLADAIRLNDLSEEEAQLLEGPELRASHIYPTSRAQAEPVRGSLRARAEARAEAEGSLSDERSPSLLRRGAATLLDYTRMLLIDTGYVRLQALFGADDGPLGSREPDVLRIAVPVRC